MKIGQMFMLGFNGTVVDDDHWITRAIEEEDSLAA